MKQTFLFSKIKLIQLNGAMQRVFICGKKKLVTFPNKYYTIQVSMLAKIININKKNHAFYEQKLSIPFTNIQQNAVFNF
jgi:hypothetical protein